MAEEQNSRIIAKARNLIQQGQSMTLATAADNNPWAAPVYYVNHGDGFYFFSSPESRHIRESLASGTAASAIYMENESWQNFTGLQMAGKILIVSGSAEASGAVFAYTKKFPLIKTFFSGIKKIGLGDFSKQFRATLYCFKPDLIFFMDNAVEFGFRETLNKDQLFKGPII